MAKGKSNTGSTGKRKAKRTTASTVAPTTQDSSVTEEVTEEEFTEREATETETEVTVLEVSEEAEVAPGGTTQEIQKASSPSSVASDASQSIAKIRIRKSCHLQSEEQENEVLEWVEENPCLWNQKNKEYKMKGKKDRLWQEKADELGIDVKTLKKWYVDLRDWNTKLHSGKSGDGRREYTDRERWVMERFSFLKATIRHRRAPVKSVKEAVAVARGDLAEAERIAAEDRLAIPACDNEPDEESFADPAFTSTPVSQPKRQKMERDDPALARIQESLQEAQAEMTAVRAQIASAEPSTERTTFIDWVKEVSKIATEDQFTEFQTTFITMQSRWRQQRQQQQHVQRPIATSLSGCYQPMPSQWRLPPPQIQDASVWLSQSPQYMQTYLQQPFIRPSTASKPVQQQEQWAVPSVSQAPTTGPSTSRPPNSAASGLGDTRQLIDTALMTLDTTPPELNTNYLSNLSVTSTGLSPENNV